MLPPIEELNFQQFHCIINLIDSRDWRSLKALGIDRSLVPAFTQAKSQSRSQIVELMHDSSSFSFDRDRFVQRAQEQTEQNQLIDTIVGHLSNNAPRDMLMHVMGMTDDQWRLAKGACDLKGIPYNTRKGRFKGPSAEILDALVSFDVAKSLTMNDYKVIAQNLNADLSVLWGAVKPLLNSDA